MHEVGLFSESTHVFVLSNLQDFVETGSQFITEQLIYGIHVKASGF